MTFIKFFIELIGKQIHYKGAYLQKWEAFYLVEKGVFTLDDILMQNKEIICRDKEGWQDGILKGFSHDFN